LIVRGPSLALRYATEADAPMLLELGSDREVTRFFSWGPYGELAEPLAYIRSLRPRREAGERLEFVIVDSDDRPIGVTGLSEFAPRDRRAIVGTWLGRPHWGTGANTESKAMILSLAFRTLGLLRATALASPENERSIAALERLGFRPEGVLRGWHVHDGVPRDCAILRLTRGDFEAGPLAEVPVEVEGEPPPQFVVYSQRK
jgi:[ribosomal protein S5]-alanine N-acetyltransferase